MSIIQKTDQSPQLELKEYVENLLENNFKARYFFHGKYWSKKTKKKKYLIDEDKISWNLEILYAIILIAIFCVLPRIFLDYNQLLFKLSLSGVFFITLSSISAKKLIYSINFSIQEIINKLSVATSINILNELRKRFDRTTNTCIEITVALVTVSLSVIFLRQDLSSISNAELGWWSIGYFYFYILCIKTSNLLTFYMYFSRHLSQEKHQLYKVEPIKSKPIILIQTIGQRVLFFWLLILIYGGSSMAVLGNDLRSYFVHMIPIGSFFSFLFGTIVYLNSEQYLKKLSNEVIFETQLILDRKIHLSLESMDRHDEYDVENLERLIGLRKNIKSNNSLLTLLPGLLGTIVPFVGPVIAILSLGK